MTAQGSSNFESLVHMQVQRCQEYHDRELFGTKGPYGYEWTTYQQLGDYVDHLRGGLAKLGVQKDDTVAIISTNSFEWASAAYATFSLGAKFTSMYETQLLDDWEYIIDDCAAKVLFVRSKATYNQVKDLPQKLKNLKHVIHIEDQTDSPQSFRKLLKVGQENPVDAYLPNRSDVMGLIYTSGTTGRPKGVILTHGNVLSNLEMVPSLLQFEEGDRTLSFLPWAHIFGQMAELHLILYSGISTGFAEDVTTIIDDLSLVRPTVLFSVPRIFNKIYDGVHSKMNDRGGVIKKLFYKGLELSAKRKSQSLSGAEKFLLKMIDKVIFKKVRDRFGGRLKFAVSGASALNPEVAKFIDALNIIVLEGYGLSETSPVVAINTPIHRKIASVGRVLPNVKVVIDQSVLDSSEDNPNKEGEIIVYGPNVMKGYHNLPEETEKVMTNDGGFRTGDIGHLDDEGFLYITGRIKEKYKLENGKYVVPGPIEEVLQLSPFVGQAFLFGSNKPYNVAVLCLGKEHLEKWKKGHEIDSPIEDVLKEKTLLEELEHSLAEHTQNVRSYEKPKKLHLTLDEWTPENGFLTPSMKLKRRVVLEKYHQDIENLYG